MSRKLTVLLLVMLILAGAMSLKTVVMAHSNGAVMMANGGGPFPPVQNGGGPFPPVQNGGGPFPPVENGGGPFPPSAQ